MSYTITINIGLKVGRTEQLNDYDHVAEFLHRMAVTANGHTIQHRLANSATEPTLVGRWVVNVATPEDAIRIAEDVADTAASRWGQEAVPYYVTGMGRRRGLGGMRGPKAEEWGPFNPAYFLTIDGHALSAPTHSDLMSAVDGIIRACDDMDLEVGAVEEARRLLAGQ